MSFLQSERIIEVQDQQEMVGILGRNDELLRVIKEHYESVICLLYTSDAADE